MPLGNFFKKKAGKRSTRTALNPPKQPQAPVQEAAAAAAQPHSFRAEAEALLTLFLQDDAEVLSGSGDIGAQSAAWAARLARTDRTLLAETQALLTLWLEEDGEAPGEASPADEAQTPAIAAQPAEQTEEAAEPVRHIYKASAAEKQPAADSRLAASVNHLYGFDKSEEERAKERRRADRRAAFGRAVKITAAVLLLGCAALLYGAWHMGWRINRIHDADAAPVTCICPSPDTAAILHSAGISLGLGDEVTAQQSGPLQHIYITRAFPVTVLADGQQAVLHITDAVGTVEEVLQMAGIGVSENDLMSHTLYEAPYSDMRIVIQRVTYKEVTVTETIPAEPRVKQSPLLRTGKTLELLADDRRDGVKELLCRETYIDGVLSSTEVLRETVLQEPVQSILLTGADVPASPINGAKYTDIPIIDNAPAEYQQLIENGVCTAYSYKPGVWGASGMYLYQGFVAVDPDKIPLGSLLYITSADGSFVYGWAIAADVCEAAVWGRVSVDCFFETYRESQLFGRHVMNIYVVGQLKQADLAEFVAKEGYFVKRIPQ